MNHPSQIPFDNIESALEYVDHLLEATGEAKDQIEVEILRAAPPRLARRKQAAADLQGFLTFWRVTTALGVLFLIGQVVAWLELVAKGFYVSTNPASSFFYIFTAAHGVHVLGGVGALLYVLVRNFDKTKLTRDVAAEVTSHYWHFMDGLWLFLLALLYLGK